MTKLMDYMISSLPIRIIDLRVESSKLFIQNLRILQTGHLPGRTLQRKNATFENWAFGYIVEGKGTFQINKGAVQQIDIGSLFFISPGATFHYGPETGGNWDEYYIRFEGDRIKEWIGSGLLQGYDSVKQVGLNEKLVNKIESIIMLMESGIPANADRAALLLESLIFEFCCTIKVKATHRSEYVYSILDYISSNIYQPINAKKIAEHHHISVSTLRRIVFQHSGYPLNEYINRLKVAEAKNLLVNSELQIKEISQLLSFNDAFYFSRLFKKYSNISANQFRETM